MPAVKVEVFLLNVRSLPRYQFCTPEKLKIFKKKQLDSFFRCKTKRRLNLQLTLNQSVSRRPGGHRQAVEEHQTGKGCNVQVAFQLP